MNKIKDFIRANKEKNIFIAGCLDSWAIIMAEAPEMTKKILEDMHELAASLRKSAGVVMFNVT